jgi:hypothetical protein
MKRIAMLLSAIILFSLLYGCSDQGMEMPNLVESLTDSEGMEKTNSAEWLPTIEGNRTYFD